MVLSGVESSNKTRRRDAGNRSIGFQSLVTLVMLWSLEIEVFSFRGSALLSGLI